MKSWLSCPLTTHYLLSLCKNGPSYQKKYLQIFTDLKIKDGFISRNQLFVSPTYNAEKQYDFSDIGVEKIVFGANDDASQRIIKWVNQYVSFRGVDIQKHVSPTITSVLCNVSVYKDVWKSNQASRCTMKVYNSFSYTDDIKYEARLIELPMQEDDFKLIIIVPNEVSAISGLFNKLVDDGLAAALGCVQPLFTFTTALEAPSIEFSSENLVHFNENSRNNCGNINVAQIGNVQINENGTNINVLTLLSSTAKKTIPALDKEQYDTHRPFYFAVLYKDIAVFIGRFVERI